MTEIIAAAWVAGREPPRSPPVAYRKAYTWFDCSRPAPTPLSAREHPTRAKRSAFAWALLYTAIEASAGFGNSGRASVRQTP